MKKLDLLVIKSFQGPLLLTFSIAEFVLLLQFLFKQLDKIIGKGLETMVILELLWYIAATLVPMALPLAILLASIMTLGNFGERYELVAMKSSGISLWRILRPLIIYTTLISGFAFFFSNNYIPIATKKMRTILYEINTKKPTINIRPNEYFSDIDNYVIRVGAKDSKGENLSDIMIFDHSKDMGNISTTYAKRGQMFSQDNGNTLVFHLYDGYSFDESSDNENFYKNPLLRLYFSEQIIRFDISNFGYTKTDEDRYSGHYMTMNIVQLQRNIDTMEKDNLAFKNVMIKSVQSKIRINNDTILQESQINIQSNFYSKKEGLEDRVKKRINNKIASRFRTAKGDIEILKSKNESDKNLITSHKIEWHRKFTLSLACLILFFIGAPLGAIIRKGGLGLPVVISVVSFILYYILSMIGENAAKTSLTSFFGMWLSSFVFFAIGLFLTIKATSDSAIMSSEGWERIFRKLGLWVKSIINKKQ